MARSSGVSFLRLRLQKPIMFGTHVMTLTFLILRKDWTFAVQWMERSKAFYVCWACLRKDEVVGQGPFYKTGEKKSRFGMLLAICVLGIIDDPKRKCALDPHR